MKLLYITNGINAVGGLERVLSLKASYFADVLNYEVVIVGLNKGNVTPFYEFSNKIKFCSLIIGGNRIQYIKQYRSEIKRIVLEELPDIVLVCDDGLKAFFTPIILKHRKIPIIYERHVSKLIEFRDDFTWLQRLKVQLQWKIMDFLGNKFDAFVVLTEGNLAEWKTLQNIKVIPNPLTFFPDSSSLLENKQILAVGKQSYQKGYDLLLQAWQKVHEQFPEWQLVVYGTKDPSQGLEKLVKQLEVESSVAFYPPEKDIQSKYLESSIYVMSSRYEGFGMVLIEAMACGVPCVSFDCNYGPSDIITSGEDGWLVPNGDWDDLANHLIKLIEEEDSRKIMGKLAKRNVVKFKMEEIGGKWVTLFESLVR